MERASILPALEEHTGEAEGKSRNVRFSKPTEAEVGTYLAEKEICEYSAEHSEVFARNDDASAWGSTGTVDFTISNGRTVERLDGGKLSDAAFIEALPRKYVRMKRELNKAKLKADGLDVAALEQLGLKYVSTRTLRLVASA